MLAQGQPFDSLMAGGYDVPVKVLWAIYAAGALLALWRTDASWPTKVGVAALWPLGPLAFVVTVAILLGASLIAFPWIAALVALVAAGALWWLLG